MQINYTKIHIKKGVNLNLLTANYIRNRISGGAPTSVP